MTPEDVAVAIVALNGGELVGRTRLQKTAFLLEQAGMNAGLEFEYHHYGPYCADLARGWDEAVFDGQLRMTERRGSQEMPYTVFATDVDEPVRLGGLRKDRARDLLAHMERVSDVVLELAATIVYLRDIVDDPIDEVKVRKPHKANDRRLAAAQALLANLGLEENKE
jgi:uncharacterized protein YwgA